MIPVAHAFRAGQTFGMVRPVPVDAASRSMSIMLLAMLVLVARLLGPVLPGVALDGLASGPALVICHAASDEAPAPGPAKHSHDEAQPRP
jgi:hypothetical protein